MINKNIESLRTFIGYLNIHRKYDWTSVAVTTYTVLGFFLAPWLLQKNMIDY